MDEDILKSVHNLFKPIKKVKFDDCPIILYYKNPTLTMEEKLQLFAIDWATFMQQINMLDKSTCSNNINNNNKCTDI